MLDTVYDPSPIKRKRATKKDMEERAQFLISYAREHSPVTVRQLYYAAEVAEVSGIDKTEGSYKKVQGQVLKLRREGRLDYGHIADNSRWMRSGKTYGSPLEAALEISRSYRKALWADKEERVEVWIEKDALAGVIWPIAYDYDVHLAVTRGFCSETFAWESAESHAVSGKRVKVLYLGDFDRSGQDAMMNLKSKLYAFAGESGADVEFINLAVTPEQIRKWKLPTREPKRTTPADLKWPHPYACELDAIPPKELRKLVENAIQYYLPARELEVLKTIEDQEKIQMETLFMGLGS